MIRYLNTINQISLASYVIRIMYNNNRLHWSPISPRNHKNALMVAFTAGCTIVMVARFDVNDCLACTNEAGAILFLCIVIAINAEGVLTCRTLVQVATSNRTTK